jgi:hypothetical protein
MEFFNKIGRHRPMAIRDDTRNAGPVVYGMREGDHWLWFVVDELDALGAINGLPDALVPPAPLEICDSHRGRVRPSGA